MARRPVTGALRICRYNPDPLSVTTLYFAYTPILAPERITSLAPGARFMFSAHYPETRLRFVANGAGAMATLESDPDHTVWGAVFSVPSTDLATIVAAEEAEGRRADWEAKAIDRGGNKHDCLVFIAPPSAKRATNPDPEYVDQIIRGARHWKLPTGWVVGLEDLLEDEHLFS